MRLVQQQAYKAIKSVEYKRNRDRTVKALAVALAKNDVVMDYLYEQAHEYGTNGKLDYHTLQDLLGELMWKWRGSWDVPEQEDSYADDLQDEIQKRLDKYKPKGAGLSGWDAVNLGEMKRVINHLDQSVRSMDSEWSRDKALAKARGDAAKLKKMLDDVDV